MGDYYTEQLVARKASGSDFMIKLGLLAATAISFILVLILPFAVIAPIVMIVVDVFAFRALNVEYEYLYVNGNLDIDKIMAKSRRKRVFSMEMADLEVIAPAGASELRQYQGVKVHHFDSGVPGAAVYEMVITQKGEKAKIAFEPNEVILDGMRMLAPRKVVRG